MSLKKSYVMAGLAALVLSAGGVHAQTPPAQPAASQTKPVESFTPSHLTVAKEVAVSSGLSRMSDGLMAQIITTMRQSGVDKPETKQLLDQILLDLQPELDKLREQMSDTTGRVFASKMTEKDLQAVAAFIKTPSGVVYVERQPVILEQLTPIIEEWTQNVESYVVTRVQAELTTRKLTVAIAPPSETPDQTTAKNKPPSEARQKFDAARKALTPAQVALAKEVALGSGIVRSYDGILAQVVFSVRSNGSRDSLFISNPELLPYLDEALKDLQPELEKLKVQIIDETAKVFAVAIPDADMKNISEFFKTPAGLVYVKQQPEILDALMPAMEKWTQRTAEYVNIRTRAELAKRGQFFR